MFVQRLIAALEKLKDIHEELIGLAERKREALVKNAVEEVSAIAGKENKLVRAIEEQLAEQADATNGFFRAKGFQPTRAVTVTELSRMVTDPKEKEALLAARDRLSETVAVLKKKNDLNQQLIEQSLAFINYSIDLVIGPDDEPMYRNPNQQQAYGTKRSGYFDSKA
ncbi:MAG TPA: flagellar protein FlgN [Paenibacillus sp.]|nr:flagellar protein FlgN [Paenibacillus sp.]